MTTEIEKTFFDTFGIEQREHKECECDYLNCPNPEIEECEECYYYKTYKFDYPAISDRILLELLVIMTRHTDIIEGFDSVDELKKFVLTDLMYSLTQSEADIVRHQVQALFKEG